MSVPSSPRIDNQLELAKWIAIVTMVIDHIGYLILPEFTFLRMIGRLAFPLFCWIIAVRLAQKPERAGKYLSRLTFWAFVNQIPFAILFHPNANPLHSFLHTFNIMVTLGFGVWIFSLLRQIESGASKLLWLQVAAILVLGIKCDYGSLGVAVVPIAALVARQSLTAAGLAAGAVAAAANFSNVFFLLVKNSNYALLIVCAFLGGVIAVRCLQSDARLPRLPGWFFYAFYPVHIFVLIVLALTVLSGGQG